jgi:Sulfatase
LNSLPNLNPQPDAGVGMRVFAPPLQHGPCRWPFRAGGVEVPVYAVVLGYLLLPSLLSLFCVRWLSAIPHGYINLEFLAIGAASMFLPRPLAFGLLLLDSLADCAYSICYTYQFSVSDLIASAHFLGVLPRSRIFAGCGVIAIALVFCCALSLIRPHPRRRIQAAGALIGLAVILLPIDILSGQNPLWHQDVSLLSGRVTRSPILTLGVRAIAALRTERSAHKTASRHMDSASAHMMAWLNGAGRGAVRPNVVLIVVESWGLLLDPHLAQALTEPYTSAAVDRAYRVSYGTAPYRGLTIPGEARELCHSTMGFEILHPTAEMEQQCLPGSFHALGYRNDAIHGYAGEMFYRAQWYRTLGFDRTWFGPNLSQVGLPRCGGAFPGICDAAIAGFIGDSLLTASGSQPQFIYWVTLNSHIPVPARPSLPADHVCAAQPALRNSAALCSWFRLVRAVHQSVGQIAAQAHGRPTAFILVGDHAPPVADPRLRSQFSSTQVPYVMLTPLSAAR